MKTIHIQDGVSEEALIFQDLINERYEEYRYDQKREHKLPFLFLEF